MEESGSRRRVCSARQPRLDGCWAHAGTSWLVAPQLLLSHQILATMPRACGSAAAAEQPSPATLPWAPAMLAPATRRCQLRAALPIARRAANCAPMPCRRVPVLSLAIAPAACCCRMLPWAPFQPDKVGRPGAQPVMPPRCPQVSRCTPPAAAPCRRTKRSTGHPPAARRRPRRRRPHLDEGVMLAVDVGENAVLVLQAAKRGPLARRGAEGAQAAAVRGGAGWAAASRGRPGPRRPARFLHRNPGSDPHQVDRCWPWPLASRDTAAAMRPAAPKPRLATAGTRSQVIGERGMAARRALAGGRPGGSVLMHGRGRTTSSGSGPCELQSDLGGGAASEGPRSARAWQPAAETRGCSNAEAAALPGELWGGNQSSIPPRSPPGAPGGGRVCEGRRCAASPARPCHPGIGMRASAPIAGGPRVEAGRGDAGGGHRGACSRGGHGTSRRGRARPARTQLPLAP